MMFHSRGINYKINGIHDRASRYTYNNKSSSFQDLLDKYNSVTIHDRNIKTLARETFKVLHRLSLLPLNEAFVGRNCNYNLRGNNFLNKRRANSARYGTESVSFLAPKIWDILPKEIKNSEALNGFKLKIKNRVPQGCPLRFCKTNVSQVATPKTWTQILDSDPGPRTRKIWTLKNQDPEKPGLRKTWILENLNSENPGL